MIERPAAPAGRDWITAAPFLATAALCAVFAFVGLGVSSYWIDELFSLFVIDHDGGLGEVLRRALTDTHPPAYYFIACGWIHLVGSSEAAARTLSAIFGVAALPVLFLALRGRFSLPASSFATAMAASSKLFFSQTQNLRSYTLCLLIASGLLWLTLAIHRRLGSGERIPATWLAGLWALGLLGAFTHFYLLLVAGMIHLFLLLAARSLRDRALLAFSGLTILALMGLYVAALLHSTLQDLHHMWFSNKPSALTREVLGGVTQSWSGLAIGAVALLALAPWVDRVRLMAGRPAPTPPAAPTAVLGLCALVIVGVILGGLAVSFVVAPSFGMRNLAVLGPFFWGIAAWLYDGVGPDLRRRPSQALIVLLAALIGCNALAVGARLKPRNEDWRASAAYVAAAPGCSGAPIPVVLPFVFGPSTPFFRRLAEQHFFGRYDAEPTRLTAYTPAEFTPGTADGKLAALLRARAVQPGCRVLAWGVHDVHRGNVEALHQAIAATAGLPESRVAVRTFATYKVGLLGATKPRPKAFVFERLD